MSTTAAATTTLPPGTSASTSAMPNTSATLSVEDLWGLPVVENATNLAILPPRGNAPRPTSCPAPPEGESLEVKLCNKDRDGLKWDAEWDRCSCGIGDEHIPGP